MTPETSGDTVSSNARERFASPTPQLLERLLISRRRVMIGSEGLSAVDFAHALNCSERTVRRYLSGERSIPHSVLESWELLTASGRGFLLPDARRPLAGGDGEPITRFSQTSGKALVGRSIEIAGLKKLLTKRASLRVAVVSGESGMGKTVLATRIAFDARNAGFPVLWGASAQEAQRPYEPLAQALETLTLGRFNSIRSLLSINEIVDEIPASELSAHALFQSVSELLASNRTTKPTLMVLEDLQWASASSLFFIDYLSKRSEELSLRLLLTINSSESPRSVGLEEWTNALVERADVSLTTIRGLSEISVRALITANGYQAPAAKDICELTKDTSGNPLQVLRRLSNGLTKANVPSPSSSVVAELVSGLTARHILGLAAILGTTFDGELLVSLIERFSRPSEVAFNESALPPCNQTPSPVIPRASALDLMTEALTDAGRRFVVAARSEKLWQFEHQTFRSEALAVLSDEQTRWAHRCVFDLLTEQSEGDPNLPIPPIVFAHHAKLAHGLRPEQVGVCLLKAALESLRSYDLQDAVNLADEGLLLLNESPNRIGESDSRLLADLLLVKARAEYEYDPESARADVQASAEAARMCGDAQRLGRAAEYACDFVIVGTCDPKVEELCEEALMVLPQDELGLRSGIQAALASNTIWSGNATESQLNTADELIDQALHGGRESGELSVVVRALHSRCVLLHGTPDLNRRRAVADELNATSGRPAWHRGFVALARGDRYEFDVQCARLASSPHPWDNATAHLWTSLAAFLDARWDDVLPEAQKPPSFFRQTQTSRTPCIFEHSLSCGSRGELVRCLE